MNLNETPMVAGPDGERCWLKETPGGGVLNIQARCSYLDVFTAPTAYRKLPNGKPDVLLGVRYWCKKHRKGLDRVSGWMNGHWRSHLPARYKKCKEDYPGVK